MRKLMIIVCLVLVLPGFAEAQQGRRGPRGNARQGGQQAGQDSVQQAVTRLMSLDTNQDGMLVKDEVSDTRLYPMLKEADTDSNGQVTTQELTDYFTRQNTGQTANAGDGGQRPMGPGGMGAGGPGGPGGHGGAMGPGGPMPKPGQILPDFLVDQLELTEKQEKELAKLQALVDARLKKILTDEQWEQLSQPMGPGGPPPQGGMGGPGFGRPDGNGGRRAGQQRRQSESDDSGEASEYDDQ